MRLRIRVAFMFLGLFLLLSAAASAQYLGPTTAPIYRTVADVLQNPIDDAPVILEGRIIKQVGKEKYLFSDGTGEIRVDIDRKHFPAAPIHEKTKVQIRGEIEKDFLESPEIDVEYLAIVK